jgi:hypothetical protein
MDEVFRSKLRGIKAELRRSPLPVFTLSSFGAVQLAFHPCCKQQGIQAKANKSRLTLLFQQSAKNRARRRARWAS